jgi:hypothetical protein
MRLTDLDIKCAYCNKELSPDEAISLGVDYKHSICGDCLKEYGLTRLKEIQNDSYNRIE